MGNRTGICAKAPNKLIPSTHRANTIRLFVVCLVHSRMLCIAKNFHARSHSLVALPAGRKVSTHTKHIRDCVEVEIHPQFYCSFFFSSFVAASVVSYTNAHLSLLPRRVFPRNVRQLMQFLSTVLISRFFFSLHLSNSHCYLLAIYCTWLEHCDKKKLVNFRKDFVDSVYITLVKFQVQGHEL